MVSLLFAIWEFWEFKKSQCLPFYCWVLNKGTTDTKQGNHWYQTRERLVPNKGTTYTKQGNHWYQTREPLVPNKGTTDIKQGNHWYQTREPLIPNKGTTDTKQGIEPWGSHSTCRRSRRSRSIVRISPWWTWIWGL